MLQPLQDFPTKSEYSLIKIIEITVFLVPSISFCVFRDKSPSTFFLVLIKSSLSPPVLVG